MWYQLLIKLTKKTTTFLIQYTMGSGQHLGQIQTIVVKIVPINHKHTNIKYFDFIHSKKIKVYHTQLQIYIQL